MRHFNSDDQTNCSGHFRLGKSDRLIERLYQAGIELNGTNLALFAMQKPWSLIGMYQE